MIRRIAGVVDLSYCRRRGDAMSTAAALDVRNRDSDM